MGKIVILDELTANQIAAGEVVERPASVIKELVENSMDAGSTSISVEIKNGGVTMMKVIDNGCGLDDDDVEIAFERHATSKIRGPKDLESIATFGFRGEALASIASVSNIELLTRTSSKDIGTLLRISGGKVLDISPAGSAKGTSITINNLFFNTPARFKFLKKDSTEAGHVADILSRAALGNPDISFKFINNRGISLHSPGNGDLKSAIFSVYGKETRDHLLPIHYDNGGIRVSGFVGDSHIARGTRSCQTFFINKRFVKSKIITAALDEAHKTVLMKNKYPFVVLNLEINPHLVDVNVHPQKLEVRFSDEQLIFRSIFAAVNHALLGKNIHVEQVEEDTKKNDIYILNPRKSDETTYMQEQINAYPAKLQVDPVKMFETKDSSHVFETSLRVPSSSVRSHDDPSSVKSLRVEEKIGADKPLKSSQINPVETSSMGYLDNRSVLGNGELYDSNRGDENPESLTEVRMKTEPEYSVGIQKNREAGIFRENYNVIGQLFKTYIIIEQEKEVLFIDQHAAHERVMFEELKQKFYHNESLAQMLLLPVSLETTTKEAIFLRENIDLFEKMGFIIEDFGHNSFVLRSMTYGFSASLDPKDLFLHIFDYIMNNIDKEKYSIIIDETLYMMACKSAIKANSRLREEEIKALVERLENMENPHTCPHGRPTVLRFTKYEMEKLFKRIV